MTRAELQDAIGRLVAAVEDAGGEPAEVHMHPDDWPGPVPEELVTRGRVLELVLDARCPKGQVHVRPRTEEEPP